MTHIWDGPKTSGLMIIHDSLERAIQRKIDEAVVAYPHLEAARADIRQSLIGVYADYGHIDCEIVPADPADGAQP